MLGLGNTAEEPWIYSAGMIGLPIVQMSGKGQHVRIGCTTLMDTHNIQVILGQPDTQPGLDLVLPLARRPSGDRRAQPGARPGPTRLR